MNLRGRRPVIVALVAETAAAFVVLAVVQTAFALTGSDIPLWSKLLLAGATAGGVALLARAPLPWVALLAALPALFVGVLQLDLPVWIPLLILLALVLVLRNSLGDRVPLYLSNTETLEKLQALIDPERPIRAIDLGCGLAAVPKYDPDIVIAIESRRLTGLLIWEMPSCNRPS